jgi:hypothetical protein
VLKLGPDRFRVLDTEVTIDGGGDRWRSYFDAFASDYDGATAATPPRASWPIRIAVGGPPPPGHDGDGPVDFHRSANYRHWSITGHGRPGRLTLPAYGLGLAFDADRGLAVSSKDPPSARASELVFHAARGLALAVGSGGQSLMVHASAVVIGGHAVLFAGTKGAGKSTLFIEALTAFGATPLANDRVTLRLDDGAVAESWPSYASYCEGTIADYPALRAAFLGYERASWTAGLTRWGDAFERDYTQARKRIVPPRFLVESLGRRYAFAAPVGALVMARTEVAPGAAFHARRDRTTAQLTDDELAAIVFGDDDADFPRWHGLPAHRGRMAARTALLRAAALPVIDLQFNPATGKPALRGLFADFLSP